MKKRLATIIALLCVLSGLPMTAFAGDIPESLLEEGAQIFFAEVLSYHPDKRNPERPYFYCLTITG